MMRVGFRVDVIEEIDLRPHTVVRRGETGIVVSTDPVSGELTIMLDRHHQGLSEWRNTIWVLPGWEGDEVRRRLRIAKPYAADGRRIDKSGDYSQVA